MAAAKERIHLWAWGAALCRRFCKVNNVVTLLLLLLLYKVLGRVHIYVGEPLPTPRFRPLQPRDLVQALQPELRRPDSAAVGEAGREGEVPGQGDSLHRGWGEAASQRPGADAADQQEQSRSRSVTEKVTPQPDLSKLGKLAAGGRQEQPGAGASSHVAQKNSGVVKKGVAAKRNPRSVNATSKSGQASGGQKAKYLIYLCDSGKRCGGWGDRVRGLVSLYLLAAVTNRTFGIHMTTPCPLTWFYLPNEVDWRVPGDVLARKDSRVVNAVDNTTFLHALNQKQLDLLFPEPVVYVRNNLDLFWTLRASPFYHDLLPPWAHRKSRHDAHRNAWRMLMKPSPWLQQKYDAMMTKPNGEKFTAACAHVRIGTNPSNPLDVVSRNSLADTRGLWPFLQQRARSLDKVFVATDSDEVRARARSLFGARELDSGGQILHIDRGAARAQRQQQQQGGDAGGCEGFGVALLDHLVLSRCEVLVVSRSMFSVTAAFIRGSQQNLFRFDRGNVTAFNLNM